MMPFRDRIRPERVRSRSGNSRRRRRTAGLTLMEMLVVFVLLGFVTTLLFQGTGFFSSRYETIQGLHRDGSVIGLRQHWFITTVQSLAAYGHNDRRFRGDAGAFEGITLQALAAEPGMPVVARWYLDGRDGREFLVYREKRGAYAGGVEWPVLETGEPGMRFLYADGQGQWRRRWPVEDAPGDWLPSAIRVVGPDGNTLLLAQVGTSASPVLTDDELQ